MASDTSIVSMKSGRHYGEAALYNDEEISVTRREVAYKLSSAAPDSEHPDVDNREPLAAGEWEGLLSIVDFAALQSLPSVIGSPDASDAGAEFIEVSTGDSSKRVEFDALRVPPKIAPLVQRLRDIRHRIGDKHRR